MAKHSFDRPQSQPPKITFPSLPPIYIRATQSKPAGQLGNLHSHPHYEIVWLKEGQSELFHDFQRYQLVANSIAFIRPGDLHTWLGDWNQFKLYVVGFQSEVLESWNNLPEMPFLQMGSTPFVLLPETERFPTSILFQSMLERSKNTGGDFTILVGYLYVLLLELSRLYKQQISTTDSSAAHPLLNGFRKLLENHYQERWQISNYANQLCVSTNHLVRTIRQIAGQTPGQMAQDRLFLESRRMLAYSDTSIQNISSQLGFSSLPQFLKWFKKLAGTTPASFRLSISKQFDGQD